MKALEANRIAKQAIDDGYDYVVKTYFKKIKAACAVGEFYITEADMAWCRFEKKHEKYFKNLGYIITRDGSYINISWE